MRDILFKGKRVDNGEWIEGYYSKTIWEDQKERYFILDLDGMHKTDREISRDTLCQYTGREIDGVKLWENDLIKTSYELEDHQMNIILSVSIFKIVWKFKKMQWGIDGTKHFQHKDDNLFSVAELLDMKDTHIKLIGSSFDHPEIMEV